MDIRLYLSNSELCNRKRDYALNCLRSSTMEILANDVDTLDGKVTSITTFSYTFLVQCESMFMLYHLPMMYVVNSGED